jgi:hypothetical protein
MYTQTQPLPPTVLTLFTGQNKFTKEID